MDNCPQCGHAAIVERRSYGWEHSSLVEYVDMRCTNLACRKKFSIDPKKVDKKVDTEET